MAPVSAEPMSLPVEVMTRAVKVLELKPWSMVVIRYFSRARAATGVRAPAGQHLQVGGRVAEVTVGVDRLQAVVDAMHPHQQHRGERDHPEGVGAHLVGGEVEGRLEVEGGRAQRDRGAQRPQRGVAGQPGDLVQGVGDPAGEAPAGDGLVLQPAQLAGPGQLAHQQQVPDLLERAVTGELGGVIAAVVVEALFTTDIPDQGLGHRHPLESLEGQGPAAPSRRA